MNNFTPQHFAATRDGLRPATIAALIDFCDGRPMALFSEDFIWGALEDRGMVQWNFDQWDDDTRMGMPHTVPAFDLTEYGHAFMSWYRQPKDLPAQMSLFGD